MSRLLRVIQWGTGNVGHEALRGILESPELELAGVLVYTPEKDGADAGALCGLPPCGVRATRDRAALLRLPADCVVYAPRHAQLSEVCELLASGKSVVATPFLFFAATLPPADLARLQAACAQGKASVHGTGIHPGFVGEVLPLALSGLTRRIEHLHVQERANWSLYASPRITFDNMRFGHPPAEATLEANPFARFNSGIFQEQIFLLAAGLGAKLERVDVEQELVPASVPSEIVGGKIDVGTVSGQRYRWRGVVAGRPRIEIEALWTVGPGYPDHWPRPKEGWTVTLEGTPSLRAHFTNAASFARARELPVADHVHAADIATAQQAVNAIVPLCAASPPGVKSFLDLPLIRGRSSLAG
jgi:hypothetical protein